MQTNTFHKSAGLLLGLVHHTSRQKNDKIMAFFFIPPNKKMTMCFPIRNKVKNQLPLYISSLDFDHIESDQCPSFIPMFVKTVSTLQNWKISQWEKS